MKDKRISKTVLIDELQTLRARVAQLEQYETMGKPLRGPPSKGEPALRPLIDSIDVLSAYVDADGRYRFINKAYAEWVGLSSEEINGKHIRDVLGENVYLSIQPHVDTVLSGQEVTFDTQVPGKDGGIRQVRATYIPDFDKDGNTRGFIALVRDITGQKQVEEKLVRQNEFMSNVLESLAHPFYVIDANDYTIKIANSAAGYIDTSKDITCYRLTHKRDKPCKAPDCTCPIETIKKTKMPVVVEHIHYDADGNARIVEVRAYPLFDSEGNVAEIIEYCIDITDRKQAENEIKQAKDDFEAVTNLTGDIIVKVDREWKWNFLNDGACEFWGKPREELLGIEFADYLHPDDEENTNAVIQKMIETGCIVKGLINRQKTPCGWRTVEWNASPVFNEKGEFVGLQATGRDITEREEAEEALRYKTILLEAQSETSLDGILAVDDQGNSILFNRRFSEIWTIPQDILDTRDDERMQQYVLNQLEEPDEFLRRVEYLYAHRKEKSRNEIILKDGRTIDRYSSPLIDQNGEYHGRIWFFRDITERKRAEDESLAYQEKLRRLSSQLSIAEERERRHLATELHDSIGQTLAVLKIKLGLIKDASLTIEQSDTIDEIRELIEGTIANVRLLTSELSPPILYELGLKPAVEWLIEQFQDQHDLNIDLVCNDGLIPLDNDISYFLFRAVRELLMNVVKHARASKTIITLTNHEDNVVISVKDDGVGFSIEDLALLRNQDMGFGLFSVKERMDSIGGSIKIESEPGSGTQVILVAPLS